MNSPPLASSESSPRIVPPAAVEVLARLFPNKKRSVLELVLRRCDHDLAKTIEHFVPTTSQNETTTNTTPSTSTLSLDRYLDRYKQSTSMVVESVRTSNQVSNFLTTIN